MWGNGCVASHAEKNLQLPTSAAVSREYSRQNKGKREYWGLKVAYHLCIARSRQLSIPNDCSVILAISRYNDPYETRAYERRKRMPAHENALQWK